MKFTIIATLLAVAASVSAAPAEAATDAVSQGGCGRGEFYRRACCDRTAGGNLVDCEAGEYCRRREQFCCSDRAFYNGFRFDTNNCRKYEGRRDNW